MENNNLSVLGDRHTTSVLPMTSMSSFTIIGITSFIGIGNFSTSAIGTDQLPFLDLTISSSCCLVIGTIGHQQLPYRPVITSLAADPSFINFFDSCPKTVSTPPKRNSTDNRRIS